MFPLRILASAAGVVFLAASTGFLVYRRLQKKPSDREAKRRLFIHQQGRLSDGMVTDITGEAIFYTYSVRGVGYMASQDLSGLESFLPPDAFEAIGPITVKYIPGNPANSIVLCEDWSGIQPAAKRPLTT